MIKQIGKIGRINRTANRKIDQLFRDHEIRFCEARFPGCLISWNLQRAHRHKRIWYRGQPEKLCAINQVALLCGHCHSIIENDRSKTEKLFLIIRGEE